MENKMTQAEIMKHLEELKLSPEQDWAAHVAIQLMLKREQVLRDTLKEFEYYEMRLHKSFNPETGEYTFSRVKVPNPAVKALAECEEWK